MKTINSALCAFLLSLLAGLVSAQTSALPPLVLPVTDRIVVGTCYWEQVAVKAVSPGKFEVTRKRLGKEDLSRQAQEETEGLLAGFSKEMTKAGFTVTLLNKCTNDDDTAGGIRRGDVGTNVEGIG